MGTQEGRLEVNVEFWIIFCLVWLTSICVIMAIFKDAEKHDRIWDFESHFKQWNDDSIKSYIKTVEKWVSDGIADEADLDHLAAAKIVLKKRKQTK
tara:strand:- start:306 stop:593 length:288 start_codon:yes stop_codon:yes gene_type:complete